LFIYLVVEWWSLLIILLPDGEFSSFIFLVSTLFLSCFLFRARDAKWELLNILVCEVLSSFLITLTLTNSCPTIETRIRARLPTRNRGNIGIVGSGAVVTGTKPGFNNMTTINENTSLLMNHNKRMETTTTADIASSSLQDSVPDLSVLPRPYTSLLQGNGAGKVGGTGTPTRSGYQSIPQN
jgi:hypothetical protein